jgi:sugar phosphate isomerase/epimerase
MKLGVFTPVFGQFSTAEMIAKVQALGHITAVELGTGGWPGRAHLDDLTEMIEGHCRATTYRQMLADAGLTISALSCHGNPLHPNPAIAKADDALFRQTVRLAEKLQVPTVVTFSGCPGDSDGASHPNWITTPWPPEFLEVLDWQWEQKAIPYWSDAGAFAADHGVTVAIEAHPGFLVYNVDTMLKLRAAAGPAVGINFDPSHLFWQGVDIPAAIGALGDCIFHVHAKDLAFDRQNVAVNGVLDVKSYRRMRERSWLFRSVGWGHDALVWKQIVSSLRIAGYDHAISIEHEDALLSIDEGLQAAVDFLAPIVLTEPPTEPWWT